MANIKPIEQYEKEVNQLQEDYLLYQEVKKGNLLSEYSKLETVINSKSFKEEQKSIESLKYKGSVEFKKEKEFNKLSKNKKLSIYFEVLSSDDLKRYNSLKETDILKQFKELEQYVKRGEFKKAQKEFNKKLKKDKEFKGVFTDTESYKKKSEYDQLKDSDNVKLLVNFPKSKKYKIYNKVEGSELLLRYTALKATVDSDKFKEKKAFLLDPNRFEKTEQYQKLIRFKELQQTKGLQVYLKYFNTDLFSRIEKWKKIFEDDFTAFDEKNWSTLSQVAQKGIGLEFKHEHFLHANKGLDNIRFSNSILKLETRKEKAMGLAWNAVAGLHPVESNYSSAALITFRKFSLKTGRIAVKVKANGAKGIHDVVALVDNDRKKMIGMFSSESDGIYVGTKAAGNESANDYKKVIPHDEKFYIIELEWTTKELKWWVNGDIVYHKDVKESPSEKFIEIASNVFEEVATNNLPHQFEVDWIKCYKYV